MEMMYFIQILHALAHPARFNYLYVVIKNVEKNFKIIVFLNE